MASKNQPMSLKKYMRALKKLERRLLKNVGKLGERLDCNRCPIPNRLGIVVESLRTQCLQVCDAVQLFRTRLNENYALKFFYRVRLMFVGFSRFNQIATLSAQLLECLQWIDVARQVFSILLVDDQARAVCGLGRPPVELLCQIHRPRNFSGLEDMKGNLQELLEKTQGPAAAYYRAMTRARVDILNDFARRIIQNRSNPNSTESTRSTSIRPEHENSTPIQDHHLYSASRNLRLLQKTPLVYGLASEKENRSTQNQHGDPQDQTYRRSLTTYQPPNGDSIQDTYSPLPQEEEVQSPPQRQNASLAKVFTPSQNTEHFITRGEVFQIQDEVFITQQETFPADNVHDESRQNTEQSFEHAPTPGQQTRRDQHVRRPSYYSVENEIVGHENSRLESSAISSQSAIIEPTHSAPTTRALDMTNHEACSSWELNSNQAVKNTAPQKGSLNSRSSSRQPSNDSQNNRHSHQQEPHSNTNFSNSTPSLADQLPIIREPPRRHRGSLISSAFSISQNSGTAFTANSHYSQNAVNQKSHPPNSNISNNTHSSVSDRGVQRPVARVQNMTYNSISAPPASGTSNSNLTPTVTRTPAKTKRSHRNQEAAIKSPNNHKPHPIHGGRSASKIEPSSSNSTSGIRSPLAIANRKVNATPNKPLPLTPDKIISGRSLSASNKPQVEKSQKASRPSSSTGGHGIAGPSRSTSHNINSKSKQSQASIDRPPTPIETDVPGSRSTRANINPQSTDTEFRRSRSSSTTESRKSSSSDVYGGTDSTRNTTPNVSRASSRNTSGHSRGSSPNTSYSASINEPSPRRPLKKGYYPPSANNYDERGRPKKKQKPR